MAFLCDFCLFFLFFAICLPYATSCMYIISVQNPQGNSALYRDSFVAILSIILYNKLIGYYFIYIEERISL